MRPELHPAHLLHHAQRPSHLRSSRLPAAAQVLKTPQRSVLVVGNPALPLKGFDVAVVVLAAVNKILPLDVTWICQSQPTAATVPALLGSGLQLRLFVSPSQVTVHDTEGLVG